MKVTSTVHKIALGAALVAAFALTAPLTASAQTAGTPLYSSTTVTSKYSRVITLANGHLMAEHGIQYGTNNWAVRFYLSTDNGASYTFKSEYKDTTAAGTGKAIGSPTIFQRADGTVLFSYNIWDDNNINAGEVTKVVTSTNEGTSWSYLSTVESGTWNWEPEFAYSSDGKLQIFYSYSTAGGSQLQQNIVRRESTDGGATWGSISTALGSSTFHMGMARIVKGGSTYYMAFEDYNDNASVHVVSSADGKTFNGTDHVMHIPCSGYLCDNWYMSAPALTYYNGALIGEGEYLYAPGFYARSADDGKKLMYSKDGGATWGWMDAPMVKKMGGATSVPNYSPGLAITAQGQLAEVAISDDGTTHQVLFGTGVISTP